MQQIWALIVVETLTEACYTTEVRACGDPRSIAGPAALLCEKPALRQKQGGVTLCKSCHRHGYAPHAIGNP